MNPMADLVALLLARPETRPVHGTAADWLPAWRGMQSEHGASGPFAATVAAALRADRLAWAFFSGYQGAIQATLGAQPGSAGAFCVNETGRKITEIASTLAPDGDALLLHGSKSWALAGVDHLHVLARRADGPASGAGSLVVVRVPAEAPGVEWLSSQPQGMVPELPHSALRFDAVRVSAADVLPGDGYADYAKPFRTREDVFVTGSVLAYLLAEAEVGAWTAHWRERAIAAIALLDGCSLLAADAPDAIIAVAGALSLAGDVIGAAEQLWTPQQQEARERWLRDRTLLAIGNEARRQRSVQAWKKRELGSDSN
jgi:acyl-CoA dehydrogenase